MTAARLKITEVWYEGPVNGNWIVVCPLGIVPFTGANPIDRESLLGEPEAIWFVIPFDEFIDSYLGKGRQL